jgi:hypothetical protein
MAELVTGDKQLDLFFARATDQMQRQVLRGATAAGATVLAKVIRGNIRTMLGTRTAEQRKGRPPLRRTIIKKYWSKPASGIIAYVVGARYGQGGGPHAHLVERGHRIRLRGQSRRLAGFGRTKASGRFTGGRTRAFPFQAQAEKMAAGAVFNAQVAYARKRLTKLKAR